MRIKLPIVLLAICLIGIFWRWWLPGPRVASDFSLLSQGTLKSLMNLPQAWSINGTEGLGEYAVFTLWSWPFNFLFGLFGSLNFSFAFLERILILIPFLLLGTFGIWKLCENLKLSNYAKVFAVIFYLTNTYIILVIDGGQLIISLSYALFPISFLAIENAINGSFKRKIIAGLMVSAMGVFDIRFLYIFILLWIIRFFYELLFLSPKKWKSLILSFMNTGLIVGLVVVGINFYWLFTLFKVPLSASIYSSFTHTSFTSLITMGNAFLLFSPHWFKNIFGNVNPLQFEFILIPILILLSPILRPKDRNVGFWMLIALISIFLTKGTSEPFGKFYPWLYSNIPGFSLFRDSSKFFFLVALSYSVLLGITVNGIIKIVKSYKIKIIFIVALFCYFIILVRPVWMGKMTGTFSPNPFESEYSKLNLFLQDQQSSNVFWIPTISPLTALDIKHPSLEASRLAQKRPFAQATVGTYESFNYLREAPYMGQLFDVANIGCIVYPYLDQRRESDPDKIKYYYTFLDQLSNLPWVSRINNLSTPTLKVNHYQNRLFITPNTWWIIGSDTIYKQATTSARLALSKNSLIFAEENADLGKRIDEISNPKIVLYHKTLLDFAASFIDSNNLIFPASKLSHDPDTSGWWKRDTADFVIWKDFLKSKYGLDNQDFDLGGGWAVAEKNLTLNIKNLKAKKGEILLGRVMESSKSGILSFYQGNNLIGEINTQNTQTNVRWFEVGSLVNDKDLIIQSQGDINVINAITFVPEDKWKEDKDKATNYKNKIIDFKEGNTEENSVSLNFEQISPTKYKINISNLKSPAFLIFSQNFDTNWKLNNKTPFPVYSLINGFNIEKNGQYELTFEPQKYLFIGLVVSMITLLTSFLLLLV